MNFQKFNCYDLIVNRWMKKNFISCFFFLFSTIILNQTVNSQVYNFHPMSFDDIENNPSKLATKDIEMIQIIRQDNFNNFSLNSIRYTKYIPAAFMGLGITVNNTNINDQYYNHIGIGLGYRNIIANKIYLKIGAMYKLIQSYSTEGKFDYYIFDPLNTIYALPSKRLGHNLNVSFSLSTSLDRYFLSFSTLNISLPSTFSPTLPEFPSYYTWTAGNLISLFTKKIPRSEISYSGFSKYYSSINNTSLSHYILLKHLFIFNRKSSLEYGARIGYCDNSYYHMTPFTTLLFRKKIKVGLSFHTYFDKHTFNTKFNPSTQINLIYKL